LTLKTAIQNVAKNVGIVPPDSVVGNTDADTVKLLQFANETGQELARRVDWARMRKSQQIEGTGFAALLSLPSDYARMVEGWAVTFDGDAVRGGITADEWNSLTPVVGDPRYYLPVGQTIGFYPFLAEGVQVVVNYIGTGWTSVYGTTFAADTESTLFPERLLEMGTVWRMKRHIGADFSDYLAEYESAIVDEARFDSGHRVP